MHQLARGIFVLPFHMLNMHIHCLYRICAHLLQHKFNIYGREIWKHKFVAATHYSHTTRQSSVVRNMKRTTIEKTQNFQAIYVPVDWHMIYVHYFSRSSSTQPTKRTNNNTIPILGGNFSDWQKFDKQSRNIELLIRPGHVSHFSNVTS